MKRVILVIIISLYSLLTYSQSERSVGIGLSRWHNTVYEQEVANVEFNFTISMFKDKYLLIPFISQGRYYDDIVIKVNKEVLNRSYLWEWGASIMRRAAKDFYVGIRVGQKYAYNKYDTFIDEWKVGVGIELQYDLNLYYGDLIIRSVYLTAGNNSVGIGVRF